MAKIPRSLPMRGEWIEMPVQVHLHHQLIFVSPHAGRVD